MDIEANAHGDPEEQKHAARLMRRALKASTVQNSLLRLLPPGYYLDRSDPDILILRRPDGRFVAAFSVWGATREGIEETAWKDTGSGRKSAEDSASRTSVPRS